MPVEIRVDEEAVEAVDIDDLEALAQFLLTELRMSNAVELSVAVVTETEMTQLHVDWLDEAGPTDVLSFPMDELREPEPGDQPPWGVLGDVVLCPAVAKKQAATAGHSTDHEIRILLTHGVLHLLGHDHAEAHEAQEMFGRQASLVAGYEENLGR